MTEDKMVGWHHQLNGHEFEQALGDGEGQGNLVCCSPWGHKELDMTEKQHLPQTLSFWDFFPSFFHPGLPLRERERVSVCVFVCVCVFVLNPRDRLTPLPLNTHIISGLLQTAHLFYFSHIDSCPISLALSKQIDLLYGSLNITCLE